MYLKYSILVLVSLLFLDLHPAKSDEVPAILWNVKGNSLQVKPVSALERDDWTFNEKVENILNAGADILVFALTKLSSEDFSSGAKEEQATSNSTIIHLQGFLDRTPYVYMSSIRDPLTRLHNIHCGVQEIVVDQNIDKNVLQSVSRAFSQSCVVILHISDNGVFNSNAIKSEENQKAFLLPLSDVSKNVVGIFTAEKSSWTGNGLGNEHHYSRHLFEVDEAPADPNFINMTCVYLYMGNATVQYKNESAQLILPPSTEGSSCTNETVVLKLSFKSAGSAFTGVVINFTFKNNMRGSWVTETTISVSGDKVPEGELPAPSSFVEAPLSKSFNCGNLKLKTRNETFAITVTLQDFQVQPFPVSSKFSESFDCVSFFTVPIWMGVFAALLFITIINVGVYALFSVHTMDRFDDPKGKTISVAVGSD